MSLLLPAPFDSDSRAIEERDKCDYSIKITTEMAMKGNPPRKIRVYADGIYDLFHQGHALQLLQAKTVFGPESQIYLLVGCTNDELTHKRKGKTVMNENERYEALRHCRYVDEIVRNAPWECDEAFLNAHKIDFVAHDEEPYTTGSGIDVYDSLKKKGMFVATIRTEGVSTSDVVARIVRDYDKYIRRNLARGYSRQDLNVSFLKGQQLRLANVVDEVKEQTKEFLERKRGEWEETSKDVIGAFLALFGGNDWSIDAFWARSKEKLSLALSPPSSPSSSPPPPSDESKNEYEAEIHDDDDKTKLKRNKRKRQKS